jgi:hypothetical protein
MKYLTSIVCFFVIQLTFSQEVFYQSSLIKNEKDTIQGYISNLYDSKAIKFKKERKSNPIICNPQQIKGFILDGNIFESHKVTFQNYKRYLVSQSLDGLATSELTKDTSYGNTTDTVFLHKLIQGRINLYKLVYKNNFTYYFVEKQNVIKELPPPYYRTMLDSLSKAVVKNGIPNGVMLRNITVKYQDYLDTLALVLNDTVLLKQGKNFDYSEYNFIDIIVKYNKKKGLKSGGYLKNEIRKKFFIGASAGVASIKYDAIFDPKDVNSTFATNVYALIPLYEIDRNFSSKVGLSYVTYQSSYDKKTILSFSAGLRYASVSGLIRPYVEASLAVAKQYREVNSFPIEFPIIVEAGTIIPIKSIFLTLGASATPLFWGREIGYKYWVFHVGFMF